MTPTGVRALEPSLALKKYTALLPATASRLPSALTETLHSSSRMSIEWTHFESLKFHTRTRPSVEHEYMIVEDAGEKQRSVTEDVWPVSCGQSASGGREE